MNEELVVQAVEVWFVMFGFFFFHFFFDLFAFGRVKGGTMAGMVAGFARRPLGFFSFGHWFLSVDLCFFPPSQFSFHRCPHVVH